MCNKIRPERCVIFCASPEFYLAEMRPDDYVIACDGGYAHAVESGVRPDLVVGDFDSYDGRLDPTLKIVRVPCEKDDTDTMLARLHAAGRDRRAAGSPAVQRKLGRVHRRTRRQVRDLR